MSVGYRRRSWTAEKEGHPAIKLRYKLMAVLPIVRSALCAASQLPREGPIDVEDAPTPAY